jgi:hypothetical protein
MNSLLRKTFVLCLLAIPFFLHAQDSARVIILSPRVGATIDKTERNKFKLFQQFPTFESAIVLEGPGGAYYVRIDYENAAGRLRDSVVLYREQVLLMLAEKINHFEDLEAKNYVFGSDPSTLQSTDTVVKVELPAGMASARASAPVSTTERTDDVPLTGLSSFSTVSAEGHPWHVVSLSGDTVIPYGVVLLDGMRLVYSSEGKTSSMPVDSIAALVREKGSHFWKSATFGMVAGAVVGLCMSSESRSPDTTKQMPYVDLSLGPFPRARGGALIIGAAAGLVCGGLIGSLTGGRESYDLKGKTLNAKLQSIKQLVQQTK